MQTEIENMSFTSFSVVNQVYFYPIPQYSDQYYDRQFMGTLHKSGRVVRLYVCN